MDLLGLEEREVPLRLLEAHNHEADDDGDPVAVVGDDGAVGGRVLPAEDRVEDAPSAAAVEFGVAELRGLVRFCVLCLEEKEGGRKLTLTCHTLSSMSYDPAPDPTSAASPPTALFQF